MAATVNIAAVAASRLGSRPRSRGSRAQRNVHAISSAIEIGVTCPTASAADVAIRPRGRRPIASRASGRDARDSRAQVAESQPKATVTSTAHVQRAAGGEFQPMIGQSIA